MQADFEDRVKTEFDSLIGEFLPDRQMEAARWLANAGGSAPDLEYIPRRRSEIAK